MNNWLPVFCFALSTATPLSPSSVQAHDAQLDIFGCHHDQDRKYYHCHEGTYKRLSFDSKTQMIERLRNQYIALGRTWPYEDAALDEQLFAIKETTIEPPAVSSHQLKRTAQRTSLKSAAKPTNHPPSQVAPKTEPTDVKKTAPRSSGVRRKPIEPELKLWISQIRADGRPIFESREGERFFLDDTGNKVLVERRES